MDIDEGRLQQFMGSFLDDMGGATTVLMVSLGDELGFYDAMSAGNPTNATELARATGCNVRLTQEWLDQQASADYVIYDAERTGILCRPNMRWHWPIGSLRSSSPAARSRWWRCSRTSRRSPQRFAAMAGSAGRNTVIICSAAPQVLPSRLPAPPDHGVDSGTRRRRGRSRERVLLSLTSGVATESPRS